MTQGVMGLFSFCRTGHNQSPASLTEWRRIAL
jgi:hypothetical protein